MVKPFNSVEAKTISMQNNYVKGMLEQVIFPGIYTSCNYGQLQFEMMLHHYVGCTETTKKAVLTMLNGLGYKAWISNNILCVDWS